MPLAFRFRALALVAACVAILPAAARAQAADSARALLAPALPLRAASATIGNVRFDVTFDDTLAQRRSLHVAMTFDVQGPGPVVLSMPAWTPGAYEIGNNARYVASFSATGSVVGRTVALEWDKVDYDTWRVQPAGARSVTVAYDVLANVFDNAQAWAVTDFAFFNGTNVFLYPEGRGFAWPATVTVHAPDAWRVVTGMPAAGAPRTYRAPDFHDLVDFPFFVGRFDVDSQRIADRWVRLATYPANVLTSETRATIWKQLSAMIPPEVKVFGEAPFDAYTVLQVVDSTYGGGSGLEHQNSHLDLIASAGLGSVDFATLYSHEIFHAWNVKRLRPADLVPYEYADPQPTAWLWVSEGITDYYGNLAAVRGGVIDENDFYTLVSGEMGEVERNPPVSLEDASLNTWIKPLEGSSSIYYEKGALAGLALDIMIRDASANRRSLDDVMRALYLTTWKRTGRGFSPADWWGTVSRAAGGRPFDDFRRRYIEGREPFPWDSLLPRAGMRLVRDSVREARVGLSSLQDSSGVRVTSVVPGSMGAEAGIQAGDLLVKIGDVTVDNPNWGVLYRAQYGARGGERIPIVVRRGAQTLTLTAPVRIEARVTTHVARDDRAAPRAAHIRDGILKGTTDAAPAAAGNRSTGGAR